MPKAKLVIEYVDPKQLKHFPSNPRVMPDPQRQALNRSLKHFGYVDPLVVRQGNEVVGGNQRLDDALTENLTEIPIVRVELSDSDAKALNLALNRIHGEWNMELLAPALADMKLSEIELTGFRTQDAKQVIGNADLDNIPTEKPEPEEIKVKCPNCGTEFVPTQIQP